MTAIPTRELSALSPPVRNEGASIHKEPATTWNGRRVALIVGGVILAGAAVALVAFPPIAAAVGLTLIAIKISSLVFGTAGALMIGQSVGSVIADLMDKKPKEESKAEHASSRSSSFVVVDGESPGITPRGVPVKSDGSSGSSRDPHEVGSSSSSDGSTLRVDIPERYDVTQPYSLNQTTVQAKSQMKRDIGGSMPPTINGTTYRLGSNDNGTEEERRAALDAKANEVEAEVRRLLGDHCTEEKVRQVLNCLHQGSLAPTAEFLVLEVCPKAVESGSLPLFAKFKQQQGTDGKPIPAKISIQINPNGSFNIEVVSHWSIVDPELAARQTTADKGSSGVIGNPYRCTHRFNSETFTGTISTEELSGA